MPRSLHLLLLSSIPLLPYPLALRDQEVIVLVFVLKSFFLMLCLGQTCEQWLTMLLLDLAILYSNKKLSFNKSLIEF